MVTDVAFLLTHSEMRPAFLAATLHCWLMFKLASARTNCPRAFSEDLLPQQSPTACVSVWDCSNPDASPRTAPCWTDECSCHPTSPNHPGPSPKQPAHQCFQYSLQLDVCQRSTECTPPPRPDCERGWSAVLGPPDPSGQHRWQPAALCTPGAWLPSQLTT